MSPEKFSALLVFLSWEKSGRDEFLHCLARGLKWKEENVPASLVLLLLSMELSITPRLPLSLWKWLQLSLPFSLVGHTFCVLTLKTSFPIGSFHQDSLLWDESYYTRMRNLWIRYLLRSNELIYHRIVYDYIVYLLLGLYIYIYISLVIASDNN